MPITVKGRTVIPLYINALISAISVASDGYTEESMYLFFLGKFFVIDYSCGAQT